MNLAKLINAVSWILIVLGVIFILWKVFGGSPTESTILITLVSGILFKIMNISNDLSGLKEKVNNLESKLSSFSF